jgi:multidrug efflux pump subunit AcrA (membrane-fusion protein)
MIRIGPTILGVIFALPGSPLAAADAATTVGTLQNLSVVVAQPIQEPVTLYIYLKGHTAPYRTANLVAPVQGVLESIDYRDGAAVTKGTMLFTIERDAYQAHVDQAAAQLGKDRAVLGEAQVDLTR